MKLIFTATIAASLCIGAGNAIAMEARQQAAIIAVANERCGPVFPNDLANTILLATSLKEGRNLFEVSREASKIADDMRAAVTTEREPEFCSWARKTSASIRKQ